MLAPEHESLTLETASLIYVEQRRYAPSDSAMGRLTAPWVSQLTAARGAPACSWQEPTAQQGAVARWQWRDGSDAVLRVEVQQVRGERLAVVRLVWAQGSSERAGATSDCEQVSHRLSAAP
jgi:hypothetical protein